MKQKLISTFDIFQFLLLTVIIFIIIDTSIELAIEYNINSIIGLFNNSALRQDSKFINLLTFIIGLFVLYFLRFIPKDADNSPADPKAETDQKLERRKRFLK